jgi:hypothetical protein
MAIKTGRYGQVSWDPAGGTAVVPIISLNAWTANQETEMEDVSCFQDTNRVYVPGLKDLRGDLGGFWNSADLTLWQAADAGTPGTLQLMPNSTEPGFVWQGPAYLNASIDASLAAPTVSGTWAAAGSWSVPGTIVASGATAGIPGSFTPAGATPPANLTAMSGLTASPATAWTIGQHVEMGNGQDAYWDGTVWVAGIPSV